MENVSIANKFFFFLQFFDMQEVRETSVNFLVMRGPFTITHDCCDGGSRMDSCGKGCRDSGWMMRRRQLAAVLSLASLLLFLTVLMCNLKKKRKIGMEMFYLSGTTVMNPEE